MLWSKRRRRRWPKPARSTRTSLPRWRPSTTRANPVPSTVNRPKKGKSSMSRRSARVVHHVKGRIRLKLHDAKGNYRFLESVQQSLSPVAGVRNVEVNSATGTIVVHYDETMLPDFAQKLADHGESADLFSLEPAELSEVDAIANKLEREAQVLAQHSEVARSAVDFVSQIDQALKQATGNTVDLKVLLPLGLAIFAFLELESDITTPLWLT